MVFSSYFLLMHLGIECNVQLFSKPMFLIKLKVANNLFKYKKNIFQIQKGRERFDSHAMIGHYILFSFKQVVETELVEEVEEEAAQKQMRQLSHMKMRMTAVELTNGGKFKYCSTKIGNSYQLAITKTSHSLPGLHISMMSCGSRLIMFFRVSLAL